MKRLLILISIIMIALPMAAQVKNKTYTEIPDRSTVLRLPIGYDELVLQTDSMRWIKVKHLLQTGWTFDTIYKTGWYKLLENPSKVSIPSTEHEISADAENDWTISDSVSAVAYNGKTLRRSQWAIITGTTLRVYMDTKLYDYITIIY